MVVLFARHIGADKDAQMTHAVVQHVDDGSPRSCNGTIVAPGVDDPVQRLRRRRDVVTPGSEDHDRRGDVAQVDGMVADHHRAASQTVADKQVFHNGFDLAACHAEETTPPALELEKALGLGVHAGPQVVVLVPPGVGRIEFLEILHQVHTVKSVHTQISCQRCQP